MMPFLMINVKWLKLISLEVSLMALRIISIIVSCFTFIAGALFIVWSIQGEKLWVGDWVQWTFYVTLILFIIICCINTIKLLKNKNANK
jgi:hypothetical protein